MKKIFLIIFLILLFVLSGCKNIPSYTDLNQDKEKGYRIEVDGIIYRTLPETNWRPLGSNWNLVARKGGIHNFISNLSIADADINKVFVLQTIVDDQIFSEGYVETYYYREDITLPPYDSSGIDIIEIKGDTFNLPARTVQDEKVVKEFISTLINGEKKELFIKDSWPIFKLEFMNSNYSGIGIESEVWATGGQYWICYSGNTFTPVAKELLEQIAGQKLPTPSEYIASQQKTAS